MLKVIAALAFSYFLISVYGLPFKIKKWFKITGRVKPFDCEYCMTFWLCLIFQFTPDLYTNIIAATFGAAYLSKFIK
jgi:hypothetical protein